MASIGKVMYRWMKTSSVEVVELQDVLSGPQKDSLRQQLVNCDILTEEKMIHNFTISKLLVHGAASQSAT